MNPSTPHPLSTARLTRRRLLGGALALPGAALLARVSNTPLLAAPAPIPTPDGFSFVLMGDLHFDHLAHHDMEWLTREKPGDVHQVQNYSRLTSEVMPELFREVRGVVAESNCPFVLQAGDLVEGLCGSAALSQRQNEEALGFFRDANLGVPMLFTKGNHDITGPGSPEEFTSTLRPFMASELGRLAALRSPEGGSPVAAPAANYSFYYGENLFLCFDAYSDTSLDWLENQLNQNRAKRVFVMIHTPVVPYGARANWHQFARPNQAALRARLLDTLGRHNAIVLGGHIHKYNVLSRRTEQGRLVQVAVSSIISRKDQKPGDELEGALQYTPDQIRVEPNFSPDTEAERRALLTAEKPFIDAFEYADAPGYAVIHVKGDTVRADFYCGLGRRLWRSHDLTALLDGKPMEALAPTA